MSYEQLVERINNLEGRFSDSWWPEVALLIKEFTAQSTDQGKAKVVELLTKLEDEANEAI